MPLNNLKQIFLWPSVIGALTLEGLVVALLKDGVLEDISLIALSLAIIVIIYIYFFSPLALLIALVTLLNMS